MVYKWNVTFPALTGKEDRMAYIYLPESYSEEPHRRYPVLYMFDGHNVFFDKDATYGKCWGMKEYMDRTGTQMIIAAVECNHHPDQGRIKEYSPYSFSDPKLGKIKGTGKQTMEWFINKFKPEIDRRFRTLPDREHTFVAGSSMGGLMSLYAVLQYNAYFSRAAALSPSVWFATDKLRRLIEQVSISPDTVIYMDYGSREMHHHDNMENQFSKVISLLLRRRIMLNSRIVPYGDHCEACWEKQIPFFMNTLLYDLKMEPEEETDSNIEENPDSTVE